MADKRLLDPKAFGLLGNSLPVDPGLVTSVDVANNPNKVVRLIRGAKINAVSQTAPSIVTLAIEAMPLSLEQPANEKNGSTLLQGILSFGSGSGEQGALPGAVVAGFGINLEGRIIFDIAAGTMLSFPTAFVRLDYLYTHITGDDKPFVAGDPVGPAYQVSYSLGYEPQAGTEEILCTVYGDTRDIPSDGIVKFARPKYASEVYVLFQDWKADIVGEMVFYSTDGVEIWRIPYVGGGSTFGNTPPLKVPWPSDAVYMSFSNTTETTITQVRLINVLEF